MCRGTAGASGAATITRSFDEPLVIAAQKGERRWVAWSFDLLDSDLPIRVAFPLMISNTLQWLAPGIDAVVRDLIHRRCDYRRATLVAPEGSSRPRPRP